MIVKAESEGYVWKDKKMMRRRESEKSGFFFMLLMLFVDDLVSTFNVKMLSEKVDIIVCDCWVRNVKENESNK
jgi:hypothetical protein